MKKVFAVIVAAMLLGACAAPVPAGERTLTDGAGREVAIPQKVERIACVGVGALRYTCYMQGADLVVGVEDYEQETTVTRPYNYVHNEAFQKLPVIGANYKPNAEAIIAADPQVVILSAASGLDADDLQNKTGIPVVVVPGSDTTLDEKAFETLDILGKLLGKEQRAEELTAYLRAMKKELSDRTANIQDKPSVYVGGVSYKGLHGFEGTEAGYGPLALIGANNLADTTGQAGAFNVDVEQILTWDPDVIFLDYEGMGLICDHYAKNPDYYESLTAVQQGRVYAQISFRSYAANLETALCDAWYAASVLYPQAFGDVDLDAKIGEIFNMLLGVDLYDDFKEAGYAFRPISIGA